MKKTLLALLVILLSACHQNSKNVKKSEATENKPIEKTEIVNDKIIEKSEIMIDSLTQTYSYINDDSKVTGILITKEKAFFNDDSVTRKTKIVNGIPLQISDYDISNKNLVGEITLEEGKFTGTYEEYYTSGKLKSKIEVKNGIPYGLLYEFYQGGELKSTINLENGKYHGEATFFSDISPLLESKGLPIKGIIYENGKVIRTYKYDKKGVKIIPITDNLELIQYKSGYYESIDNVRNKILYLPMVILKFKNIENEPFQKEIKIKGVFISNGEEWSVVEYYFQTSYDSALMPKTSRQLAVKSDMGWLNPSGIRSSNIRCQLYINNNFYKEIKIERRILSSNRI